MLGAAVSELEGRTADADNAPNMCGAGPEARAGTGAGFATSLVMTGNVARRWVENYARVGFMAKGVVYLILGTLALRSALGAGGRITGQHGVVRGILSEAHGPLLAVVLAVGLAGFALWRLIEAFADANRKGTKVASVITRAGYAASGLIYGTLALDAVLLALGEEGRAGRSHVVQTLLGGPFGPLLVVLVALGVLAYAVVELVRALRGRVDDELGLDAAPAATVPWLSAIVNFGTAARAVVFALVAVLLLRSAATPSAAAAIDATDGLRFAARLPEGRWWLAFVAAGFAAYGVEHVVQAFYRRIVAPALPTPSPRRPA